MQTLFPKLNSKNSQAGITLLLAVLVLAAITAIAFSLAAIITIEIRSSGDVARTEPALYAVQGVTEEAFFKYKRFVSDGALDIATNDSLTDTSGCVSTAPNICTINGVSMGQNGSTSNPPPAARQYDPTPRIDVVATGTTNRYLLIDPSRPNDFGHAYDSVKVTLLNGISGATSVISLCCDASGNSAEQYNDLLTQNIAVNRPLSDPGQYEVAIHNPSSTTSMLVQIDAVKTTAVNGQKNLLPLQVQTLDITASYLGLTRKYSVSIP